MNLILDVLIVLIALLCASIGYRRGFIKTFFGLFQNLVAFVAALLLAHPVGEWLNNRFIGPALESYFVRTLAEKAGTTAENLDLGRLPDACASFLSRFGATTESVRDSAQTASEAAGESVAHRVASAVTGPVAAAVSYALAFLALFVLAALAIKLIVHLLDLVAKLPGLKFSNRLLGLVIGAVQGIFLAYLAAALLKLFAPGMQSSPNSFLQAFDPEETTVIRFLNRFDPLAFFHLGKG